MEWVLQHQTQPAQTTGFDKVAKAGTYRIPIDAFGLDLGAPTPLNGIIQAQHHQPMYGKRGHQQSQKHPTGFTAGPDGTIEYPVKILKVLLIAQTRNSQSCGYCPLSGCQVGSQQQDLYTLSNTF